MLIAKTNPVGIDVAIQKLQTYLHSQLVSKWGLTGDNDPFYQCHGRVYRNKKDAGYIAEVFDINTKDYKEVYWDDTLKAISWFGISGKTEFDTQNKVDVHLIFFVDLKKLKPDIQHRADEEVRNEIQKLFGYSLFGFSFESIELWIDNVLREYPGSRRDDRLKAVDMHPVHCFRINLKSIYSTNIC
jgi:hypothetical protein